MKVKHLHIVSFDVPFPPNYGGAMDVFFRIQALHELGVKIHLHCFEYGRGIQEELKQYVETVQYYKRKRNIADNLSRTPFIVKSRDSKHLIRNLLLDDYPILFEGLHTCYFLSDERLKDRKKFVRMHNIEHDYYASLAKQSSGWKKRFFEREAKKLKRYESVLRYAEHIFAIKPSDAERLTIYKRPISVLPASIPSLHARIYYETEPYCLYHGNLSVPENLNAVKWLAENVFAPASLTAKFVVAGKSPSQELKDYCHNLGIKLVSNPSDDELEKLIQYARIHVLYSDQSTGVKLKLLNALSSSGHVIVNYKMIEGTDLSPLCDVALIPIDFKDLVIDKLALRLSEVEFENRMKYLVSNYNTVENCKTLLELI